MSAELKAALKEAREFLKQGDHSNTIKKCKKILKKDKDNYGALILLAAAMREVEEFKLQAPLAFQRAIEIQPNNPLAWQGLVAYYEKDSVDESNWSQLVNAYCKILQLDSNSLKFSTILEKVCELSLKIKDKEPLARTVETLDALRETSNEETVKLINKTLAWMLTDNSSNAEKYQELLETVLPTVIRYNDVLNKQEYYRKYLKVLIYRNKITELVKEAREMHRQFPQDVYPLECACRVYYEENVMNGTGMDIDITEFFEPLLKLDAESESAAIAKAMYLKETENFISAREILNHLLVSKPQSYYAWTILSEISTRLYCWEEAENAARQALQLGKQRMKNEICRRIVLILIESMSRSDAKQKWESASQMCKTLLKEQPSLKLELLNARTSVLLNDPDANNIIRDLESKPESETEGKLLEALNLKNLERLEEAVDVFDSSLESSEAWELLGKIYWEMSEYNQSLVAFLKGVKADRHNWECLIYLGRYYHEHEIDIDRSRKCYQTALQINPNSEEAGIGLSTAYRLLKNKEANMQLLQRLTMQDSGPKWAWLQLGLQYLDQDDAVQAIKAFQHVIRADPTDNHSWESLADAYYVRGAYTSALKSYQRALELCPSSLYPMIQLANIKIIIGHYSEAKDDFENILSNDPYYFPALKGLTEACLGLAKENLGKQFLGRARSNFQQAADNLTIAISKRTDLSCIWKLLGDTCYRIAIMSDKYCYLQTIPALIKSVSTEERVTAKRQELFSLSISCYCRALSLSPDSSLLWHDLACCYWMQMHLDPKVDVKTLANKCLAIARHAVKLNPAVWIHWNFLGVISISPHIKNYALAQHSFVTAIEKESNNAVLWSNLGTLYLHTEHLYKANKAYSLAQRSDPAYINSWTGQSLIAEIMDREEAMDLFRHSTQLGYHSLAATGYAHWVVTIILKRDAQKNSLYKYKIEKMRAVSVVTDVLNWYIEHHPDDSYARNTYGLLLERQGLYRSSAEQFAAALSLSDGEHKELACINLARVLIQLQKYEEAVELCRTVKNINFNSQSHLALSLFKAEQYEESYAAYETLLCSYADTGPEKANTLCAMAAIAYIFQRIEDAKTLLFQCIQIQPLCIPGFLAAASLGILHGDMNLTTLVLKELKSYEDHPEYSHHVSNLSAYTYLIQNQIPEAVAILSKGIHRHPHEARYWKRLLRILLETGMPNLDQCVQKALFLSRSTTNSNFHASGVSPFVENFKEHFLANSIRSTQKQLFKHPADMEMWAIFISNFLSSRIVEKSNARWLLAMISMVQENKRNNKQMTEWLHKCGAKVDSIMI